MPDAWTPRGPGIHRPITLTTPMKASMASAWVQAMGRSSRWLTIQISTVSSNQPARKRAVDAAMHLSFLPFFPRLALGTAVAYGAAFTALGGLAPRITRLALGAEGGPGRRVGLLQAVGTARAWAPVSTGARPEGLRTRLPGREPRCPAAPAPTPRGR